MKKIFWALGVSFVVISVLLLVIAKRGVIVRPQPLIKPTAIQENFEPVAKHVALRMFPDFQSTDYVIWKLDAQNSESEIFQQKILQEYTRLFAKSVNVLSPGQPLGSCPKPCWIFSDISEVEVKQLSERFIVVSWVNFEKVESIPDDCMNKKILDSRCIKFVSLKSAEKKLKDPNARYFFLHKYIDQYFYLFIQLAKN